MKSWLQHPDFQAVEKVYHKIKESGYQVLFAGGCVRDGLLGLVPNDFDLASNATPEQIESLFDKTIAVGKAFGVILVVESGVQVEVTSFRSDDGYIDGRRPTSVHFSSPEVDAQRRDFTINALFYDLKVKMVLDFVGGEKDLAQKTLRAVGDAERRFSEDHLRLLRAVRFVGQLGFSLEASTRAAMVKQAHLAAKVSGERLHEEMGKLLASSHPSEALRQLVDTGILKALLPKSTVTNFVFESAAIEDPVAHWIRFWVCNFSAVNTEMLLRQELQHWKFSNADKTKIEKALRWYFLPKLLSEKSIGELADICFESSAFLGLKLFVRDHSSPDCLQRLAQIQNILDQNGGSAPQQSVRAADLQDFLSGAALGRALKSIYWLQLEGRLPQDPRLLQKAIPQILLDLKVVKPGAKA